MTAKLSIPSAPDDLTSGWLTAALRSGGVLADGASVTSVSRQLLGEGAGFVGQIVRCGLEYDLPPEDAPRTLIAKMPAREPGGRQIAALYGLYEREYHFYRELAPEITFRTPRCYYSAGDASAIEYVLLLEDLSATGRVGDQVQGCPTEQAGIALRELALHHARWWNSPRLTEVSWLQPGVDIVAGAMQLAYPQCWQPALDLFGDRTPPAIRDALPRLGERVISMIEPYRAGPLTLIHGDYRLDNMFFGNETADYTLAVFDWQSPNQGWGAYDIAYFLYGNIDVAARRKHELDFLREYHDTLVEQGVKDYPWERLFEDYRSSLVASLAIWVVNAATLDTANERGLALFELFFDRLSAAISDHDALSMLPA